MPRANAAPRPVAESSRTRTIETPDRVYERISGEKWGRNTRYLYESHSNTAGWAG